VLADVVVDALLATGSDPTHQLAVGGMAASPEIPATSSLLAPQAGCAYQGKGCKTELACGLA
jgi:hypothetical protein